MSNMCVSAVSKQLANQAFLLSSPLSSFPSVPLLILFSPQTLSPSLPLCHHRLTERGQLVAASSPGCTSISALHHRLPNLHRIVRVPVHPAPLWQVVPFKVGRHSILFYSITFCSLILENTWMQNVCVNVCPRRSASNIYIYISFHKLY